MYGFRSLLLLFKHSRLPFLFMQCEDSNRKRVLNEILVLGCLTHMPAQCMLIVLIVVKVMTSVLLAGVVRSGILLAQVQTNAQAAIRKYHTLGGVNNRNLFYLSPGG